MSPAQIVELAALCLAAFGAATILPFQSEFALGALIVRDTAPVWLIVAVASIGNTLGSLANWLLGWHVERFAHRSWFPASEAQLARAKDWYARRGVWSLLLSWAPFMDPLTMAAGLMKTPLRIFLPLVAFAKTARYVVVAWALL